MTWCPQPLRLVSEATASAVHAAFPKGDLYVDLRTEFGTLYDDQLFADLCSPQGHPVEMAPWHLALVMACLFFIALRRQAIGIDIDFYPSWWELSMLNALSSIAALFTFCPNSWSS